MILIPRGWRAPEPDPEPQPEPSEWCPRCEIHRIRQDAYSGTPTYVALCPVCESGDDVELPEECESCPELALPGEGCRHDGHVWCSACFVERCQECAADLRDAMADAGRGE